jgi:hypothetical protein
VARAQQVVAACIVSSTRRLPEPLAEALSDARCVVD